MRKKNRISWRRKNFRIETDRGTGFRHRTAPAGRWLRTTWTSSSALFAREPTVSPVRWPFSSSSTAKQIISTSSKPSSSSAHLIQPSFRLYTMAWTASNTNSICSLIRKMRTRKRQKNGLRWSFHVLLSHHWKHYCHETFLFPAMFIKNRNYIFLGSCPKGRSTPLPKLSGDKWHQLNILNHIKWYMYQLHILHSQPFVNKYKAKSRAFLFLITRFLGLAFEKVGLWLGEVHLLQVRRNI